MPLKDNNEITEGKNASSSFSIGKCIRKIEQWSEQLKKNTLVIKEFIKRNNQDEPFIADGTTHKSVGE